MGALLELPGVNFAVVESASALENIFRLRYKVWVEEFSHVPATVFPSGLVQDEFDPMAVHAAAFKDRSLAAAVRLILHSDRRLPFHRLVNIAFPGRPGQTAEISHLVIDKVFRRRKEDGLYGAESYLKKWEGGVLPDRGPLPEVLRLRRGPVVTLGLFRTLYQASKRQGILRWLLMADRKLLALLQRYGMPFRQVADSPEELPGRLPTVLHFDDFENRLFRLDPDLFWEFMDGLETEYRPAAARRKLF